ncbi:hypothetical protein Godav_025330 [Gossypium davidsonii]|uniref:Uncharacterized protein n=1 Tax=Gossypium davidsonii TaxID=34287 RepID=A0A7J8T6Q2_GOSDV|nr:hypothetical protein [Gossypium davidsonii]
MAMSVDETRYPSFKDMLLNDFGYSQMIMTDFEDENFDPFESNSLTPFFSTKQPYPQKVVVWTRLPSLPREMYKHNILWAIGN